MQYTELIWRDGQPYSERFDDIYFSAETGEVVSGEGEFEHVFFRHNGLPNRWQGSEDFVIAELGFGSGLNCILTLRHWLDHFADGVHDNRQHAKRLHYIAIEKYPLSSTAIRRMLSRYPELKALYDVLLASYPPAVEGIHSRHLFAGRVIVHYHFQDALLALNNENYGVDAWYLDGFSPAKNADMWSQELFDKVVQNSHVGTTCSTYTAAGFVRRHMQQAGFTVDKVDGHGRKRDMLVARLDNQLPAAYTYNDRPWLLPPKYISFEERKATVIGGGIAGLSTAYALVRRGWQVTLIDQSDSSFKASSNPAAIVYPRLSLDHAIDTEFYVAAHCYAVHTLAELQREHLQTEAHDYEQQDTFWFECGLLQAADEKRIATIIDRFCLNSDYVELSDALEVFCQTGKNVDSAGQTALRYKTAGVVLPPLLLNALRAACGDALTLIDATVSTISYEQHRWRCMANDQELAAAEVLVIANGAAVDQPRLPLPFPIDSVRGQAVSLAANAGSEKISEVINAGVYLTPRLGDYHYLGATFSRHGNSLEIDKAQNEQLLSEVDEVCPNMFDRGSIGRSWVGFRAVSKDRVAIVGAVPDVAFFEQCYADIRHGRQALAYEPARHLPGLFVSLAHGSRGFTSCLLSGELIASQVNGEPAPVSRAVQDYLCPSRFIINDLKRR